ncbi:MAG: acyltransferase [Opitutae bacterium]|nr:acyltransferase [Opitutae bacterium]
MKDGIDNVEKRPEAGKSSAEEKDVMQESEVPAPFSSPPSSGFARRAAGFLRSLPREIAFRLLLIFSSSYRRAQYRCIGPAAALQYFFVQRVCRINAHVPWLVHWSSHVSGVEKIRLASHPPFPGYSPGQYIQAANGIQFGANVIMAPGVKLISANHDLDDFEKHLPCGPIVIGDNCWIGANAVLLPETRLGNHVIVGAGAVVSGCFPDNCVIAGVPARQIRDLGPYVGAPPARTVKVGK